MFTEENCRKAFEASGLVPIDAQVVINRLDVRLRTLLGLLPEETPWQSKTPSNTHEFGSQSRLVGNAIARSPTTARDSLSQLVKGAEIMLYQSTLLVARVHELEEQLEVTTKQKGRKRKRLQTGGILEYSTAAEQVAAVASSLRNTSKKARGSCHGTTLDQGARCQDTSEDLYE